MDESDAVAPFGFFTVDALRAGWYLIWRQLVRVVPAVVVPVLVGLLLAQVGLGAFSAIVMGLGLALATIWAAVLIPRLTIQWAEQWYGATLTGQIRIWWEVSWRVFVASLVAIVICTPPNFVALSLSTSYPASALGMLGGLLTVLLGVASFVVAMLATGWAMSKVAVGQIPALPLAPPVFAPAPEPVAAFAAVEAPVSLIPPAPVVVAAPAARPSPTSPPPRPPAAASGKQCPKCGLSETERGSVIGWYCRVCGWREGR
ncbi:MAG TPA: hypothetical protein VGD07_08115 [Methylomirabilota bacterium]